MPRERGGQGGFTLLEVMVAFIIAAIASLLLYRAAFGGASESTAAALYQQATVRAQSRLASIGTLTALHPARLSGDDGGGFRWQVVIAEIARAPRLGLYAVRVTESFGHRSVTLVTERLALAKP